jgi:hypothetical protein
VPFLSRYFMEEINSMDNDAEETMKHEVQNCLSKQADGVDILLD